MITGRDGYDTDLFMYSAKETFINLLENNPQTKVKLILKCIMERTDIKTGTVTAREKAFHAKKGVNLESTDADEIDR